MGIKEVVSAARSPWQNAYVERIIGSIRRECLDHVIIFGERHLRGVLSTEDCKPVPAMIRPIKHRPMTVSCQA